MGDLYKICFVICMSIVLINCSIEQYFGTKKEYDDPKTKFIPPTCDIVHVTLISRHGSRMPVPNGSHKMQIAHEKSIQDDRKIKDKYKWILDDNASKRLYGQGELVEKGRDELYNIGKRMSTYLPHFFSAKENRHFYHIESTCRERTTESSIYFQKGFFNVSSNFAINYKPCEIDTKLRAYDVIKDYDALVKKNAKNADYIRYTEETYPKIIRRIFKRTGIKIPLDSLERIFQLCIFDNNLYGDTNKWCQVFEKDDLEKLEFAKDLSMYWARGYGNNYNSEINCVLMDDLIHSFELGAKKLQMGNIKFAHDYTLLPLMTTLGLYNETISYDMKNKDQRSWRLSNISPFSNNIMILMTKCQNESDHRLYFYHNEIMVDILLCDNGWCYLNEFKSLFWKYPYCKL